jgi:16S rRNA (guanine527-N7)-methyltransferase
VTETATLEAVPPAAEAVFGDRLPLARRYADLLVTVGVERGLLGPREPSRIWSRHLLNSTAVADLVPPAAAVVDLGSGAGLPGIPLALARPDLHVTLLEPLERRAAFLSEVVAALGIEVAVVRARAEQSPGADADVVVARAVAPLVRLVPLAAALARPDGVLLALKGTAAAADLAAARAVLGSRLDAADIVPLAAAGEPTFAVRVPLTGSIPCRDGSRERRRRSRRGRGAAS